MYTIPLKWLYIKGCIVLLFGIYYNIIGGAFMGTVNMRVDENIHAKIKEIASKEGKGIQEITEEFLRYCISKYIADETLEITNFEKILNNRISKLEEQLNLSTERLAALTARVGIDNSMNLMGNITILEKLFKMNRSQVVDQLRKDGVRYFSTATKEDKERRKAEKK